MKFIFENLVNIYIIYKKHNIIKSKAFKIKVRKYKNKSK